MLHGTIRLGHPRKQLTQETYDGDCPVAHGTCRAEEMVEILAN